MTPKAWRDHNIVLKENTIWGSAVGLPLSASTAERYNASGNVGYQSGPLTLFTSYGFNWDERQVTGINDPGSAMTPFAVALLHRAGHRGRCRERWSQPEHHGGLPLSKRDVLSQLAAGQPPQLQ
jgi:hypothetical protein